MNLKMGLVALQKLWIAHILTAQSKMLSLSATSLADSWVRQSECLTNARVLLPLVVGKLGKLESQIRLLRQRVAEIEK
jgi:hypothetical protein